MGLFSDYYNNKRSRGINPDDYTLGVAPTAPVEQPQFDSSNALKSLTDMMVTPAEREAEQARLERGRNQLAMWTGLFDGLRQLGNLYYTAKGARPQQYSDPYKQVDDIYKNGVKRLDDMAAYRNQYAKQLYDLQRQAGLDDMQRAYYKARENWYDTRDDVARMKAENDRLKAIRVIKQKDGSLLKYDPFTGELEELRESDPLYGQYMQSVINRNNRTNTGSSSGGRGANNGTYGYKTTTYYDEQGRKITERVPTTNGNQPRGQEQPTRKVTEPKPRNKAPQKKNEKKPVQKQTTKKRKSSIQL